MTSSVSLPPMLPSLADAGLDRINRHCVYYYGLQVARGVFLSAEMPSIKLFEHHHSSEVARGVILIA